MNRQKTSKAIVIILVLGILGCLSLLSQQVRQLIIELTEKIVMRRVLEDHGKWHNFLISFSIHGLFAFVTICIYSLTDIKILTDIRNKFDDKTNKNILVASVSLITTLCLFTILYKANWTFSDDHEFIRTTAVNKYLPIFIVYGRFQPVKYIHYNFPLFIIRLFGIDTGLPVEAHYLVVAIIFLITVVCLFLLFNKILTSCKTGYKHFIIFLGLLFFLIQSDFTLLFMSIIFPDTKTIMQFSIFMLFLYQAQQTDKLKYYFIALITAVYATYCKEPVFGVFLVIALCNLIFGYKNQTKKGKVFNYLLIANGIIYIILYYFIVLKTTSSFYNQGRVELGRLDLVLSVFKGNPVLLFMFAFSLTRLFFIIVKKDKKHLFYDSLLFAGCAYICAYFLLHLNAGYYYVPAIILLLPSFVYWISIVFEKLLLKKIVKKTASDVFALCLLITIVFITLNHHLPSKIKSKWNQRTEFMPYINELYSDYLNEKDFIWYESNNMITDNTFFIAERNWRQFTINSFLNYLDKTEGNNFFSTVQSTDNINFQRELIFFYPVDNDQGQPMPDLLKNILSENNFYQHKNFTGVLVYKRLP